jgi:DNA repair exonuclease SbcCD ATPase subunit
MSGEVDNVPRTYSGALMAVLAVALVAALAGLIWCAVLGNRLTAQQSELAEAKQQNSQLQARLRETDARLEVATDELKTSLGLTQKQLDARAQEIAAREQRVEADAQKLENAQKKTAQQVTAVSSAVTDVKTDVGGVKTDVAKTQSDLAAAVSQLTSMKGDLSSHASLIARNRDELEILKHRGDRNYYEFTLVKGEKKPVGTVSLELRKADSKKSKFTLLVYSDDKQYEKRDRNVNEPLQFYSGKDPLLFEIVVNSIGGKNSTITGYLSAPKSAPAPAPAPASSGQ